ncbi:MAG: SDR family oxidoreductase [Casimicrobiaceae bacterium]|nr:SDR family oxidoreductase [Casimicrobiaceae bacterium]MCX8097485.1 SDR family oxidoreductase [Casimicrobiaceae bacterium]MDW8311203.1 SDR family oxidoreductase [Burkholderiales bacterium]
MKPVALVTGASSGIGRAAALALNRAGFSVVLAARRASALEATARAAVAPDAMFAYPCDVTDPVAVRALFDAAVERFGRLDVLFNNAGRGARAVDIDELALDEWRAVVEVNLNGMFYCAREAFRVMKAQQPKGGRIIMNGSISAYAPRPFSAPYTATKHAIAGLTKALALDGRAHDIAVGQIDIGNAATEMTERMAQGILQADGSIRPEPRIEVELVAEAVVQMARLPLDANILFMTLMATKMPFVGRG